MAITENIYSNVTTTGPFSFTFPYLEEADVKVSINGVATTAFTLNAGLSNITLDSAPSTASTLRIYRVTDIEDLTATFATGSAIRARDLNDNFEQTLYVVQEVANYAIQDTGDVPFQGDLDMNNYKILNVAEPTTDGGGVNKKYVDDRTGNVSIPGHTYWRYTATGGETVLSGTGDVGGTLQYSATREQVFLNGALQQRGVDYTANDGLVVTMTVALTAGDIVDIRCVNNLASGNTDWADDISYGNEFTGQVTRDVSSKLSDVVSVKDFGAVGDGVTDDTAAIRAALTHCGATGAKLIFPEGTFLLTSGITLTLTKGIKVECSNSTVIKAAAGFPASNRMFLLDGASRGVKFAWDGGTLDGRLRPAGVPGEAPDLLSIGKFDHVSLTNTHYLSNDSLAGTAGDSCLFIADCFDVNITGNIFQGAVDAGIYVSADATGVSGSRLFCSNNTFIECVVAFISKRVYTNHIVSNNQVRNCATGIVVGGEADSQLPGKLAIIEGNYVENVANGIEVRISDDSLVTGNKVFNYGIDASGSSVAGFGIAVSGSNRCLVTSNLLRTTSTSSGVRGIRITARVAYTVTYNSTYNTVSNNVIHAGFNGIVEQDAGTDYNRYVGNQIIDTASTKVVLLGANSLYGENYDGTNSPAIAWDSGALDLGVQGSPSVKIDATSGAVNYIRMSGATGVTPGISAAGAGSPNLAISAASGILLIGGTAAGNESLRMVTPVSTVNAIQITGSVTGTSPEVSARGADASLDLRLTPKGAGAVRFGTHTATADTAISGYITIKDSAGNTRKLAVIT